MILYPCDRSYTRLGYSTGSVAGEVVSSGLAEVSGLVADVPGERSVSRLAR